jgi:hypothetical protein
MRAASQEAPIRFPNLTEVVQEGKGLFFKEIP